MNQTTPFASSGDNSPVVAVRVDTVLSSRDERFLREMAWTMGITPDEAARLCLIAGIDHYRRTAPRMAAD
jgi:hypothetical protein